MARRTWLGFHHTVLQLQKLFITGAKIEALPFGPFSFFPLKCLITARCEVMYPFVLLIFLAGINPDFVRAP